MLGKATFCPVGDVGRESRTNGRQRTLKGPGHTAVLSVLVVPLVELAASVKARWVAHRRARRVRLRRPRAAEGQFRDKIYIDLVGLDH